MNELYIEAKLENIDDVLDFVDEHIKNCPPKIRSEFGIVVDEIFSNIARYAYSPSVGGVTVRVAVDDDITLEFEDGGMAYNPLSAADPDLTPPVEERQIGGLGVFMVKNIMDSMEYRRDGNKNILTVKKRAES